MPDSFGKRERERSKARKAAEKRDRRVERARRKKGGLDDAAAEPASDVLAPDQHSGGQDD